MKPITVPTGYHSVTTLIYKLYKVWISGFRISKNFLAEKLSDSPTAT